MLCWNLFFNRFKFKFVKCFREGSCEHWPVWQRIWPRFLGVVLLVSTSRWMCNVRFCLKIFGVSSYCHWLEESWESSVYTCCKCNTYNTTSWFCKNCHWFLIRYRYPSSSGYFLVVCITVYSPYPRIYRFMCIACIFSFF